MKLMPASCAFAMIRFEVASSVGPPNIIVPKQIGDTLRPLRPSWRYCMGRVLSCCFGRQHNRLTPSLRAQRSNPEMRLRRLSGLLRCARNDAVGELLATLSAVIAWLDRAIRYSERAVV